MIKFVLKFGVVDHLMDKTKIDGPNVDKKSVVNTKFKTNLTVQAIHCITIYITHSKEFGGNQGKIESIYSIT